MNFADLILLGILVLVMLSLIIIALSLAVMFIMSGNVVGFVLAPIALIYFGQVVYDVLI